MSEMILKDFRQSYPFIAYGEEYAKWSRQMKWYKYLYNRLCTDGPSEYHYDVWKWFQNVYKTAFDECEKAFKVLPKPTKDQHNQNYDINVGGKWPEKAIKNIKKFLRMYDKCSDVATDIAAILTENEYHINVLKEKTCYSMKDMKKGCK